MVYFVNALIYVKSRVCFANYVVTLQSPSWYVRLFSVDNTAIAPEVVGHRWMRILHFDARRDLPNAESWLPMNVRTCDYL